MTFYEVVGRGDTPRVLRADSLTDAKEIRDRLFQTGKYDRVFIRQYMRDRNGYERYRLLRKLMKMQ